VALIKTDYEEGRLQPPPAGHPKGELLFTGFSVCYFTDFIAPLIGQTFVSRRSQSK
jgi:hypothetical protein